MLGKKRKSYFKYNHKGTKDTEERTESRGAFTSTDSFTNIQAM